VILLAGDIEFDNAFLGELEKALRRGSRVLMSPQHREALGEEFRRVARQGEVEVLESWTNPQTSRSAAISDSRLRRLAREALPVEVSGDPIQYQVNRTTNGWVIELINNGGVAKQPDQPAITDPSAVARVVLHPGIPCASAREWRSNRSYPKPEQLRLEVGPGQSAFVEFIGP
jgi:hypothetical protein